MPTPEQSPKEARIESAIETVDQIEKRIRQKYMAEHAVPLPEHMIELKLNHAVAIYCSLLAHGD